MVIGRSFKTLARFTLLIMVLVLLTTPVVYASAQHNSTQLYSFADGSLISGSRSTLVTNDAGATMTIRTSGLPSGHAVTIWWVVFNHPDQCTDPVPDLALCGEGDLEIFGGAPAVGSSVLYAAGHVIGGSGRGNFGGHLKVGDTTGALFGPGLVNPRGAEIHLVVRTHGPAIPGLVHEQISTFGGGCNDAPPDGSLGAPGPNECEDLQFAVHQQ